MRPPDSNGAPISNSQPPIPDLESRLAAVLRKVPAGPEGRPAVYLAAISGGADSTAMLTALAALREEMRFALYCVHVEHGIRAAEESRGDALAVKNLCEKLKVPCRVISIPQGKIAAYAGNGGPGIEGAARFFRYKALRRERRRIKADWILTAHTRDDQLETILMRVLRGSGPAGLAPMPPVRGRLFRPLLDFTRQDVLDYLSIKGIPHRTDSTNKDIAFLRNRLRRKLIPVLDEFFPSWRTSLLAMAETQALTADFLASEVSERLAWEEYIDKKKGKMVLRLMEADFLAAPPILREEAVFAGVDLLAAKSGRENRVPRRISVRRAVELGDAEDLGPVRLEKQGTYICLTSKNRQEEKRDFSLLIKDAGLYTINGSVWQRENSTCGLGAGLSPRNPDLSIRVFGADDENNLPPEVFLAQLPLVFCPHKEKDYILRGGRKRYLADILDRGTYSRYTGIITACDAGGPVAFIAAIGKDLLVINRDNANLQKKPETLDSSFFKIKIFFGGKDV